MRGGYRASSAIGEEERHAVGSTDRDRDGWISRHNDVGILADLSTFSRDGHVRPVDLTNPHQPSLLDVER